MIVQNETERNPPFRTCFYNRILLAQETKRDNDAVNLPKPSGNQKTTEMVRQEMNKKIINLIVYNKTSKKITDRLDNRVLTEQTHMMGGDVISNFKNLQNNLGGQPLGSLIDYDNLYERLAGLKFPPVYLFEQSTNKKGENDHEVVANFITQEKELLCAFQESIIVIHQKKENQTKIRANIHEINLKIKALKKDVT